MERLSTALLAFAALFSLAAKNLLYNGDFSKIRKGTPVGWSYTAINAVRMELGTAPGKKNAAVVKGKSVMIRQNGMRLAAGEEYELSAMIRIDGPDALFTKLYVINQGWDDAQGPEATGIPKDGKWHKLSKKFKLVKSSGGYGAVLWVSTKGNTTVRIADVSLQAENPAVEAKCESSFTVPLRGIIPLSPFLSRIPEDKPVLKVALGQEGTGPFFCLYRTDSGPEKKIAFRKDSAELDLGKLTPGHHKLTLRLADAKGKILFQETHTIQVLKKAVIDTKGHKRLNNLTVSLLEKPFQGKSRFTFCNPREGWVFIRFPEGTKVQLNGKAMRYPRFVQLLPAGTHTLAAENGRGTVIVRAIPEIMVDPTLFNNYIPNAGVFDWAFLQKYMIPASTIFNTGRIPPKHYQEFHDRGLIYVHNVSGGMMNQILKRDTAKVLDIIRKCDQANQTFSEGGTIDELYWGQPAGILWFAKTVRNYPMPANRYFSCWYPGIIPNTPVLTDALSMLLNRTERRNMIYHEAYCVQQRTPEAAQAYLNRELIQTAESIKAIYPAAWERFGLVLGTFNQIPLISVEIYPDCDYKYYLEMQFQLLANHPELKDIGCFGCWATYYGDEEMTRWFFRLAYHYAIEGKKEMLSPQYGFTFKAEYLKNTDFEEGMKYWTVTGDVKQVKVPKLGKYEQRWRASDGVGETCALLKGGSSIRQTAKGLVAGRLYRIKYATVPYASVRDGKNKTKIMDDGIRLRIGNVAELPKLQYDGGHILKRNAPVQIHRRVFRAKGTTAEFEFRNEKAGSESVMNFVQLTPYYPDEDFAKNR